MPERVQRRERPSLKNELKINIVRTFALIPSRRIFWTAANEIGLLVLVEIPGWQHIGMRAGRKSVAVTSRR